MVAWSGLTKLMYEPSVGAACACAESLVALAKLLAAAGVSEAVAANVTAAFKRAVAAMLGATDSAPVQQVFYAIEAAASVSEAMAADVTATLKRAVATALAANDPALMQQVFCAIEAAIAASLETAASATTQVASITARIPVGDVHLVPLLVGAGSVTAGLYEANRRRRASAAFAGDAAPAGAPPARVPRAGENEVGHEPLAAAIAASALNVEDGEMTAATVEETHLIDVPRTSSTTREGNSQMPTEMPPGPDTHSLAVAQQVLLQTTDAHVQEGADSTTQEGNRQMPTEMLPAPDARNLIAAQQERLQTTDALVQEGADSTLESNSETPTEAPAATAAEEASLPLKCYAIRCPREMRSSELECAELEPGDIVVVYSEEAKRLVWAGRVESVMWAAQFTRCSVCLVDNVEVPVDPLFTCANLKYATGASELHDGRAVEVQDQRMVKKILALWARSE
jgi:hypothetical protein